MLLFLFGEDTWRKKQKLNQIIEKFIREVDPTRMNVVTFAARVDEEETLASKILAAPFLARKRMVVLNNFLTSGSRKDLAEQISNALQKLHDYTIAIVNEDRGKPKTWKNSEIKKLWEYLEKSAKAEEFKPLWGNKLEAAIIAQAKEQNVSLTSDAAALLGLVSQGDLGHVEQELQKLAAYCLSSGKPRVDKEMIKEVCASLSEVNIFDFLDALGGKSKKTLMETLQEQFEESEPVQLIPRIVTHLRALFGLTLAPETAGKALKIHPFQLKKIQSQIRNWDSVSLKRFLFELLLLDFSIKRGLVADARTQLTAMLARVVS